MQILFPEHDPGALTVADILIEKEADEERNEEFVPIPDRLG
jgi:hypothetical protein